MIERYQELLNSCIDIQEDNRKLEVMKKVDNFMKGNMEMLREKAGKHSKERYIEELENTIEYKDREIRDIKNGCIEEFKKIKDLCFCNDYNGQYDDKKKLQKIFEIATDNYSILMKDIAIEDGIYGKTKIIELPKTDQSAR